MQNKKSNYVIIQIILLLLYSVHFNAFDKDFLTQRPVTIAILAKDKAHCLPLYLTCIEQQTWPKDKTYLYIRTNNNNDATVQILEQWIEKVKDRYLGIYFDATDAACNLQQYGQHEWNATRVKILGEIRQQSINRAYEHNSHYFVADCDNFILPNTIKTLVETNLPIVAPLLHSNCAYSNFHADIDPNGYMKDSTYYLPLVNQEIKGLIEVPVVHCTYFIRYEILPEISYDDESYRFEYVIFSDTARKKEYRNIWIQGIVMGISALLKIQLILLLSHGF